MNKKPNPTIDLAQANLLLAQWRKKYDTPAKVAAAHRNVLLKRVSQSMAFENQPVSMERLKSLASLKKAR